MTPLRAGDLNRRVTFRRSSNEPDGQGGFTTSWDDVVTVWAEVTGLDGRESVMDHVLRGISVYRLRIRHRSGLLPSDQVRFAGQDLNVRSIVDPDSRRVQLVIMADNAGVIAG